MLKIKKKTVSLLLAALLGTTLFSGCSSGSADTSVSQENTASTNTAASESKYTDYSQGFPDNVTIEIPVYDRGYEGWNVTDNYYTKWIQKEFGDQYNVTVKFVAIGRTTEVQDFNQMIASHTAPNIIFHYDMPQAVVYYSSGAMQNIDYDEVAYYAPTYWSNMEETIKKYGVIDGNQAFIFAGRDPIYYNWVTLIRQDWLDQVGAQMPTNLSELDDVARKWKKAGLGTLGDSLITKSFTYEYPFIGSTTDDKDDALYLDLNIAPFTWSATEDYLKAKNSEYNEGLIDPEFYLNTEDSLTKGKFVSGKIGTYGFYISSGTDVISSLLANDPDAKVSVLSSTAGVPEDSHAYYYAYPPYGMIMGINADATDEQRAAVYMYLDWMSQSDNLFCLQHGVEGKTYTLDSDGIATAVAGYTGEEALSQNNNKDYWCLVQETTTYGDEAKDLASNKALLSPPGYEDLIQQSYDYCKQVEQYGIVSTIFTKSIDSSTEYTSDLATLWQKAYVDCITCDPSELDAKYKDYCQQYLDAGYQDILDEKQSLLDSGDYLK